MVSCQSEYSSSYEGKHTPPEDVKPTYLVGYGPVSTTNQSEQPTSKSEYDPYYQKLSLKADDMKIPKTEVTTTSSCSISGRSDLLVPKTESSSSGCRSPPAGIRPAYDPYLNQDSNSSSMSSVENMNARSHHQMHHPVMGQHLNPQQSNYNIDDARQHQMTTHRSPYHQSPMPEDMYHRSEHPMRPYGDMSDSMSGGIARPVVTYPNDIVGRTYDTSMVNSSSHRPYDPGTNTAFERYDSSNQCNNIQQPLMPPRVPPQGMYGYGPLEEQEQRYQQEAVAQQQHQMVLASVTTAGMMKAENDPETTTPLYPR